VVLCLQVAGWKANNAVCKERQHSAEMAEMEAHIARPDAACDGLGNLKGKKKREKMVSNLAQVPAAINPKLCSPTTKL
jgi:hypothetical protein